jgi:hypothetical protein
VQDHNLIPNIKTKQNKNTKKQSPSPRKGYPADRFSEPTFGDKRKNSTVNPSNYGASKREKKENLISKVTPLNYSNVHFSTTMKRNHTKYSV